MPMAAPPFTASTAHASMLQRRVWTSSERVTRAGRWWWGKRPSPYDPPHPSLKGREHNPQPSPMWEGWGFSIADIHIKIYALALSDICVDYDRYMLYMTDIILIHLTKNSTKGKYWIILALLWIKICTFADKFVSIKHRTWIIYIFFNSAAW